MNESQRFAADFRELLTGLLRPTETEVSPRPTTAWARVLDRTGLPERYKGESEEPVPGVVPRPAVHHVRIRTQDTFSIPGYGNFTAELEGYSQVVVSEPSGDEWGKALLYVNYTEHKMFGHHPAVGDIMVELNPDIVSGGNIFPSPGVDRDLRAMACRVNIAALFHLEKPGITLFNKTPIQIASDDLEKVPPLREGGVAHVFSLPLYRIDEPNGDLVGYIEAMDYQVLDYAPRELVNHYRVARSFKQFKELTAQASS